MRKWRQNQCFYFILPIFFIFFQANICLAEFTIEDEKKVGKEFFDKLEEHELLLKNKDLSDYINEIGARILAQTSRAPFNFKFSIVDSSAINAFATPGGYIYINKGLIMAAESEAQLAGVIAHEIGHANARHVASIIQKSKRMNIAAMAAVLAGLFLGGGGETSAAIAAFSMAGASTMTLRYMRQHEEEADRMGIEYLARAGYCPTAMIEFLKIMKQYEFLSKTMPSYMQTHPGTDDRIFYIESLILTRFPPNNVKNIIGNFMRIQDRVPLNTSELGKRYKKLEEAIKKEPDNVDLLYSLATVEDKLGQTASALEHFHKALTMSPHDYDILKNIGSIYLKTNETDLAKKYLHRALNLSPEHHEIILTLGRTYFAAGEYDKALECYLRVKDLDVEDTDIHYLLAMAYGRMNNKGDSHYHFGLHFKNANRYESALFHFQEALNYFPKNSERTNAINQEIKGLEDRPGKRSGRNPRR